MPYGYEPEEWSKLVAAAERILARVATAGAVITYGDFAAELEEATSIAFDRHGTHMDNLLGDVYERIYKRRKVSITSIVVLKDTQMPGVGFWNMSQLMGLFNPRKHDKDEFWIKALQAVHASYKSGGK
ncbi:MAG: hypothetical protein KDB73_15030 [Planctomycetes bacterium]|nr:hypothetical protein [Planctomycetota bacterium]